MNIKSSKWLEKAIEEAKERISLSDDLNEIKDIEDEIKILEDEINDNDQSIDFPIIFS